MTSGGSIVPDCRPPSPKPAWPKLPAPRGSLTRATQYAARAKQSSPTDPDVLYLRAVVLVLAGQRDAAMQQLSEAIDRNYPVHFAVKDDDLAPLRSLEAFQRLTAAKPK